MDIKIAYTDKEITPWGGILLMKKMLDRMEFDTCLDGLPLPAQGSNRGYSPDQLIKQFMCSVWCGANRFEHTEVTRADEVVRQLWGFQRMAGHKAFQRYFSKFDQADNQRVFTRMYQWFFSQLQFETYTLDVDSTIHTRYGSQQGAKKGYNPRKPGRPSHHPLMGFVAETNMVANFWQRSGDAHTANNLEGFLADTVSKLAGKSIGLLRGDSGFYSKSVFEYLDRESIAYIVAAPMYAPLQRLLGGHKAWWKLADGLEVGESVYQSPLWQAPRRIVMVRQHVPTRPRATGRQLRLFAEQGIYKNYRYSCYITSLDLSAELVWELYKKRADAENRIKELKYDFGAGSFNMQGFFATEAALNVVMMAYNFISLFRQVILRSGVNHQLKTLRYRIFNIGGYLTKNGSQRVLKLSLAMKRREWFTGLWMNTSKFTVPLRI